MWFLTFERNKSVLSATQREAFIESELASVIECLRFHWPEYLMEAAEVALYLFLTCVFASLLLSPASPVRHFVRSTVELRALMGIAVGATVVAIVMSPWGKQSGGHFNPALTLVFYRLGKMRLRMRSSMPLRNSQVRLAASALLELVSNINDFGSCASLKPDFKAPTRIAGVPRSIFETRSRYLLPLGRPAIRYAVTAPGIRGNAVAFIGEVTISFVLMSTILVSSNHESLTRYTPYLVGLLYAIFITLEAPLSGMSMNPARSFGPALHVNYWHAIWLYFTTPTLGMLIAAEVFLRAGNGVHPFCAKLHHANNKRCIFRHGSATDPENGM
jgi:aquaporin Z